MTEPKPIPQEIWTHAIVLGWCDSAGCESAGHEGNNCRLARALADAMSPSPDAEALARDAFLEQAVLRANGQGDSLDFNIALKKWDDIRAKKQEKP